MPKRVHATDLSPTPSKKMSATDTHPFVGQPQQQRKHAMHMFKNVIRVMDGEKCRQAICSGEDDGLENDGPFSHISDDCIVMIMKSMLAIPKNSRGLEYFELVDNSVESIVNLALTCRRFAFVLSTQCPEVQAEILARRSTRVLPGPRQHEFAFSRQVRDEILSCDHLTMLKSAEKAMALHSANKTSMALQNAFNRDIKSGALFSRQPSAALSTCAPQDNRLLRIADCCNILEANQDGTSAFMYIHERLSKVAVHGEERGRRYRDVIARAQVLHQGKHKPGVTRPKPGFVRTHTLQLDSEGMSPPCCLRTSPCGTYVAFVRVKHDESDDSTWLPFSLLFVWHIHWDSPVQVVPGVGGDIDVRKLSVQDAWFREEPHTRGLSLVVAWSTDYVHPSGHSIGSRAHAEVDEQPKYQFHTYTVTERDGVDYFESTFAERGTLLTCSPCCGPNKVCTLVKLSETRTCVNMHDLEWGVSVAVTTMDARGNDKGLVAAGVSPMGDLVVVVCDAAKSLQANLFWQTGHNLHSPVKSIELSTWLNANFQRRLGLNAGFHSDAFFSDLVLARLDVKFSACGRFFAVVDRHAYFGSPPVNSGVLIIDTVLRGRSHNFRPFPLFPDVEQAPRSFQWTRRGIFLMPPGTDAHGSISTGGGALCLFSPT